MSFGTIALVLLLGAVMAYAARNLALGLRNGRIDLPGGRVHSREHKPGAYWAGIAFEAAMVLIFGFILARQFA